MSLQILLLSLPLPGIPTSLSETSSNIQSSYNDKDFLQNIRHDLFSRLQQLFNKKSIDIRPWDIPEFKVIS